MTEELQAISVGLRVDLSSLDRDLTIVNKKADNVSRKREIKFVVGGLDTTAVKKQLDGLTRGKISVTPTLNVTATGIRTFKSAIQTKLAEGGGVKVPISANLAPTEITRIRGEIERAFGGKPVVIPVTVAGGGGSSTPAAPSASGAARARPAARSAPVAPVVASGPVEAATARPARAPRTPRTVAATPSASSAAPQQGNRGGALAYVTPSGPASSLVGRQTQQAGYQPTNFMHSGASGRAQRFGPNGEPLGDFEEPRNRVARYLAKRAGNASRVDISSQKGRAPLPDLPESPEFETQQTVSARIRRTGVRPAFFGTSETHPRLRSQIEKLQFYRFDPVLGQAFEALDQGELGEAKALLTGFSQKLMGVDPRKRRRFFKLFKNVENVPPELVEKHAALRGLYADIALKGAEMQVGRAEASTKAFKKAHPGGVKSWDEGLQDDYKALLDAAKGARGSYQSILRGTERAGGGPVKAGGLMARRLAYEAAKRGELYQTGEVRDEAFIGKSGHVSIIPKGTGPTVFAEDGKVEPFVPPWLRNLKAKDLTQREGGGPVRGFGGRAFRSFAAGEKEAIKSGLLTAASAANVQRVFVVNFPAGGAISSAPNAFATAAGPLRFTNDKDAEKFAQQLGGHIGRQMKEILGATAPVEPKATEEKETPVGPLTPEERARARLGARQGATTLESRITAARSATAEAQQLIPVRSLSVAVGQIFSTIFGGRGDAISRAREANSLAAKATTATSNFRSERQKLLQLTTQLRRTEDPRNQTALIESIKQQAAATRLARNEAEGLTAAAEKSSASIITQRGALANLAAGTVGVVTGTLAFSAALGVAQAALDVTGKVVGPVIERLTGFQTTAGQVTQALADQTRQEGGAVQSTVALSAAQAGLSKAASNIVAPTIETRVQTEAGNKALKDQIDLLHTYEAVSGQNAGKPADRGLTGYTGGTFGTLLGGVPGTEELVANELANVPKPGEATGAKVDLLKVPGQLPNLVDTTIAQAFGNKGEAQARAQDLLTNVIVDGTKESQQRLDFFNAAIQKGGEGFKFVAQSSIQLDQATKDAAVAAANQAGAFHLASNFKDGQAILLDAQGKVVTDYRQIDKALQAINVGATTADPAELLKGLQRQILAQRALAGFQSGFARTNGIPGQFALGQLAAPTAGLKGGPAFESGLVGFASGKPDKQAQAIAASAKKEVGGAIDYLNSQIDIGKQSMIDLVGTLNDPTKTAAFVGLLKDIETTGKQISEIQTGVQQEQTNLQVAEYNNQLRIAKRSLQDAKDLQAAIAGETKDTVGGLEGANVLLQRQLALLGFELQQRQINFRLATAGFVAPGTTPEERAARIDEAKTEAAYAQKQLDLQKQIAANQYRATTGQGLAGGNEVQRQLTDLNAQINLLTSGRTLTLDTVAAQKKLDILNQKEQLLLQNAGTYIQEANAGVDAMASAAANVLSQTGKGFGDILGQTANAWGIFGTQAQVILNALTGTAPSELSGTGGGAGKRRAASGLLFDTSGETDLTVGEAGRETVAVLRNPRKMTINDIKLQTTELTQPKLAQQAASASMDGGIHITVIVTGNTISKDADIHELAEEIAESAARKAEERLQRKASLLNLRRA